MLIALGQYDIGWQDAAASLNRAADLVGAAARARARLVVLPEMCPSGFTMDSRQHAETLDGYSVTRLAGLARNAGTWILAGVATRQAGLAYNSALLLDPDGQVAAAYDKQKLFDYAGEGAAYVAGQGPVVFEVDGVRLSPFVCYDLRFPELFRAAGTYVDVLLVIANWPAARQAHWDTLLPAPAVENLAYVIGVNRTGNGGDLDYAGGSAAYGPWGDLLARAGPTLALVDTRPEQVTRVRRAYPFNPDRRHEVGYGATPANWPEPAPART